MLWVIFGGIFLAILYRSLFSMAKVAKQADKTIEQYYQDSELENDSETEEASLRNQSLSTVLNKTTDFHEKINPLA